MTSNEILAIVGTFNGLIITYFAAQTRSFRKKLDSLVSNSLCIERQENCQHTCEAGTRQAIKDLNGKQDRIRDDLARHSHSGLHDFSVVTGIRG